MIRTPAGVAITISPSSRKSTSRVWDKNAVRSEARKNSPSPSPTTSGQFRRAPTSVPGSRSVTARKAYDPRSSATVLRTASSSGIPAETYSSRRWAITSVSVSEQKTRPLAIIFSLSVRWFSTIPLWMTATRPARCGCAFSSEGRPWVAHRVCPTPHVPETGSFAMRCVRRSIFPWDLRTAIPPPVWIATPAESYPRYSSRRRPSTRISTQEPGPV